MEKKPRKGRINESQSAHIEIARAKALKRFERARDDRLERKAELMQTVDKQFDIIGFALSLVKVPGYKDLVLRDVKELMVASYSLGFIVSRMESFEWLQDLWSKGVISKQGFIQNTARQLKLDSKNEFLEVTELIDLFLGSGYSKKPKFGKGIPESTKRQYRNTLTARRENRKT